MAEMDDNSQTDVIKRDFPKAFRGYDTAAVDKYIGEITENYSELYREKAELEHLYADAKDRLSNLEMQEEQVKRTLETARAAADKIVSDAYERSDAILSSIKKSCDKILRSFKDKVENQKNALDSISQNIFKFKNELYERYRLHIELIEQLSPVFEYEEDLSPEQYVEKVVEKMSQDVSEEFGISLQDFTDDIKEEPIENEVLSDTVVFDSEPMKVHENKTEQRTEVAAADENASEKSSPAKKRKKQSNKKKDVISLIDEYSSPVAMDLSSAVQMSFDFDLGTGELSDAQ